MKNYQSKITKLKTYKGKVTSITVDSVAGLPKEGIAVITVDKKHYEFPFNRIESVKEDV